MQQLQMARTDAQKIQGMTRLKNIGTTLAFYADDHNGEWPKELQELSMYFDNNNLSSFNCPTKPVPPEGGYRCDYIYFPVVPASIKRPSLFIVVMDKPIVTTRLE